MKVFDVLPQNYFSILVSKNKDIYIDALFVLREAFKNEMSISRENIISRLIASMEEEIKYADFTEDEDLNYAYEDNISAKAHFILRKFKNTGWIDFELQRDTLEENIVIPNYSTEFIELLYSLIIDKKIEYGSYVFTTYVMLKNVNATNDIDEAANGLKEAYENTKKLIDSLKSLYNTLGIYHKKLCNKENINEIVKEHFVDYKTFSDEIIYPLVTRYSIPRYKGPILDFIDEISIDNAKINEIIRYNFKNNNSEDEDIITNEVYHKLDFIKDTYTTLDEMMNQIQNKNNDYIRASTNRINYLLTNDKEIKGKIINVLRKSKEDKVINEMIESVDFVKQEYVTGSSVYLRDIKDSKREGIPLKIEKEPNMTDEEIKLFMDKIKNKYSTKMIKEYMEKVFEQKAYVNSDEFPLNSMEDFIMLIMATIKSDKSFYYVEYSSNMIINNGYKIPNMRFIRR